MCLKCICIISTKKRKGRGVTLVYGHLACYVELVEPQQAAVCQVSAGLQQGVQHQGGPWTQVPDLSGQPPRDQCAQQGWPQLQNG